MNAVKIIIENNISIKRACNLTGINERTYYYRKIKVNNTVKTPKHRISNETINRIKELSAEKVTYGYKRIWALLRNSGTNVNKKTVYKNLKQTLNTYQQMLG